QAVMEAGLTPEKFLDLMHTLAHLEIAVPAGE
ncbi:MAG: MarR family transcriptional regulator, partial [Corynebacterium sp.]|nr:MarR family transcriptional regulator [Corynebacterium sp.]